MEGGSLSQTRPIGGSIVEESREATADDNRGRFSLPDVNPLRRSIVEEEAANYYDGGRKGSIRDMVHAQNSGNTTFPAEGARPGSLSDMVHAKDSDYGNFNTDGSRGGSTGDIRPLGRPIATGPGTSAPGYSKIVKF